MSKTQPDGLNETQIIVMCAIFALVNDAYGIKIYEKIEQWLGKPMNIRQVYKTADGLVETGLLIVTQRPSPHRKGRLITVYKISDKGRRALRKAPLVPSIRRTKVLESA